MIESATSASAVVMEAVQNIFRMRHRNCLVVLPIETKVEYVMRVREIIHLFVALVLGAVLFSNLPGRAGSPLFVSAPVNGSVVSTSISLAANR